MVKRSRTAGGEHDDGAGGSHGYNHREHGHDSRPIWHRRHSARAAQEFDEDDVWWRDLARSFGWGNPNRNRGRRRRP